MKEYQDLMGRGADMIIELVSLWGLKVLGALAVLVIGWGVSKRLSSGLRRGLVRANMDATLVPFFANMAYYLALVVTGIAVLNLFGIETTSLIAVLGAATVAIGLALQGMLSSFASGVMLLIFRPFKVGDFVDVGGVTGNVAEVGLFSTLMHTPDNVAIVVPNSQVYGQVIRNFSANQTRRHDITMSISYGDDIEVAMDALKTVLAAETRVLKEPEPFLGVVELADSSVNILVRCWCATEDYFVLKTVLLRAFKEQLEAAGCSIPYPQHEIHMQGS